MSKTPSLGTGEAMPSFQNIELTFKGTAYCEAYQRDAIRSEATEILEGCLDIADRMIAILDSLDDNPDLEPNGDDEPSLGWPMGHGVPQLRKDMAHDDDREFDDADDEDNGDREADPGETDSGEIIDGSGYHV